MSVTRFTNNLKQFRLVTFDVTDTLLKFSTSPAIQYAKTASSFGYKNIDQNQLNKNFKREFKKMVTKYPNYGKNIHGMEYRKWWHELVINIFKSSSTNANAISDIDLNRIAEKLIEEYATEKCWTKIDGANEIVDKIKDDGKIVGIISNSDPRLHEVVKRMSLPQFDFICTSYELGYEKPDKRIFDKVLDLCGIVDTNEALHIGNTIKYDYLGAKKAGWHGLHISNYSADWVDYEDSTIKVNENHVFNSIPCLLNKLENSNISW